MIVDSSPDESVSFLKSRFSVSIHLESLFCTKRRIVKVKYSPYSVIHFCSLSRNYIPWMGWTLQEIYWRNFTPYQIKNFRGSSDNGKLLVICWISKVNATHYRFLVIIIGDRLTRNLQKSPENFSLVSTVLEIPLISSSYNLHVDQTCL